MTLPKARLIVVEGTSYEWLIKGYPKDRYNLGWTAPVLQLTVKAQDGSLAQYRCQSKHWTAEHDAAYLDEPAYFAGVDHKIPFGPSQVKEVIQGNHDLKDWTVDTWVA